MSSQIQDKLLQYEVPPPAGAWEGIAAALDEAEAAYPQKLYHFEAPPGEGVWEAISTRLSAEAPVVPFFRRYRMPLKYSGVAAALLVFVVLTSLLISKTSVSEEPAQNLAASRPVPKKSISVPVTIPPTGTVPMTLPPSGSALPLQSALGRTVPEKMAPLRPARDLTTIGMMSYLPQAAPIEGLTSHLPADKYLILSNADGQALRLSRKVFDAFACAAEDIICKQKLHDLQSRMAASALSTDFSGVMEMLRNLQENQ